MPVRRHADPSTVQYIWDSIRSAKHHNHLPELSTIIQFLQSEAHCSSSQAELYVSQTLKDGLIVKYNSKGLKHPPTDYYKIPMNELTAYDDGKDWYCIECHLAGDVTPCKLCHRVFHAECSQNVRHKQMVFQCIEKYFTNALTYSGSTDSPGILNNTATESILNSSLVIDAEKRSSDLDYSTSKKVDMVNHKTMFVYEETICSMCNLHKLEAKCDLPKEELNYLLGFILHRIRSWLPSNITHNMAPTQKYEWNDAADLSWRATQLFYKHVDMNVMKQKLQVKEYTKLIEFMADVITIQHNVAIFHGIESQEYGAAELMIRDTCHDVSELLNCVDCYRHSNEKTNSNWFCLPCRRPHKLVWAKQKGYPYWPAKIIKETETTYDVRFFGGKYERSILPKNKKNILPIETKPKNQEIKRSTGLNKALEELKLHQRLLENPTLSKKYITENMQDIIQNKTKTKEKPPAHKVKTMKKRRRTFPKSNDTSHVRQTTKVANSTKNKPVKRKSVSKEINAKLRRISVNCEDKNLSTKSSLQEIIPISDAEDDDFLTLGNDNLGKSGSGCYGHVSSSTECFMSNDDGFHAQEVTDVMHPLEQPYSDAVEKMRRKLEQTKEKKQLISIAMDCMQQEIDKITNDHNEHLKRLFDAHQAQIRETKKKQWCYNCEQDAIYHCCWNTAYCSPACQQQHWQAEHKKVCRRKR